MADIVTYQLEGMQEVLDAISQLSSKEMMNIVKATERRALTELVVKPVRTALPYSKKTKRAIKVTQDKNDRMAFYAGATSDAFWLRFVEKGTNERVTKSGRNKGSIKARPIAIPTIENSPESIVEFFNKSFGEEVEKQLQKRLKKYSK